MNLSHQSYLKAEEGWKVDCCKCSMIYRVLLHLTHEKDKPAGRNYSASVNLFLNSYSVKATL
jgi:hypothetical protein